MGCEIIVAGAARPELHAIERLFAERDRRFSRFREDSELNRVNGAAVPILVSQEFASALDVALEAAAASDGLVDPTLGAAVVRPATTATLQTSTIKLTRARVRAPRRAAGSRFG